MNPLTPIRSYLSEAWKMTCLSRYAFSQNQSRTLHDIMNLPGSSAPHKACWHDLKKRSKNQTTLVVSWTQQPNSWECWLFSGTRWFIFLYKFHPPHWWGWVYKPHWIQIMNSVYQSMVSYHKQTAHPENPSQNPSLVSQELGNVAPSTFCLGWKALNQRVFNPSSGRDILLSWPAPRIAGMEMTNIWDGPDCDKKTRFVPGK